MAPKKTKRMRRPSTASSSPTKHLSCQQRHNRHAQQLLLLSVARVERYPFAVLTTPPQARFHFPHMKPPTVPSTHRAESHGAVVTRTADEVAAHLSAWME